VNVKFVGFTLNW